jgi:hypothetical protein
MVLYRAVGSQNRVALGDLATAEYYAADKDADGTIHLKPVKIVSAPRRGTDSADEPDDQFAP